MPLRGPKGRSIGSIPPRAVKPKQKGPKQNGAGTGSILMVRNLPLDVKIEDVTELFTVTIGALAKPVEMFFDARAEFSGTALVHFQDRASAGKAWEQLNEKLVDGKTKLYLFLVFQSPPTPALSISAPPPPPPITSLGQLAPFPSAQQKPRKPAKALAQRLGPAVVPLASRLGKVVGGGEGVQIQVQGQPKKKKAGGPAAAAASLKKKAPGGAGRKKRSSAAKAVRMEVD